MNRQDAESVYRNYAKICAYDSKMLSDLACMTHSSRDELEESWREVRREWVVSKLMEVG